MPIVIPFARNDNAYRGAEIPDFDPHDPVADMREHKARIEEYRRRSAEYARLNHEREARQDKAQRLSEEKQRVAKRLGRTMRKELWWSKVCFTNGYKILAYEYFTRTIRGCLSPAEQAVFFFIFDRTVWWLKEWETIRLSQFTVGSLPDADGLRRFTGTGMSERTVRDTLKVLVEDGLVLRRSKQGGNGLQEYALPRADQFRDLPRFAGMNITYRGTLFRPDGQSVQVTL